jgi:hypothetical protein
MDESPLPGGLVAAAAASTGWLDAVEVQDDPGTR